jgi:hypothetical protein
VFSTRAVGDMGSQLLWDGGNYKIAEGAS